MKYKVGDKVRVVKINKDRGYYKDIMERFLGKVAIVSNTEKEDYLGDMPVKVEYENEKLWLFKDEFEIVEEVSLKDGVLTLEEEQVIHSLIKASKDFEELEHEYSNELEDFKKGVELLQSILKTRALRRENPDYYITIKR